ncbi:Spo0B C-terminal domain-containing protein [Heyndrickxia acidiproducens]|uniref:Spo0B C-terminal domain-containing protein n=1 Tax=Heyndrickxia acidiproducens TaxID=1121084 RepID=UPI00036B2743|nr:Spo0B C-terminal domain-containing protein [Heyndrickxia acidiproducens]
MENWTTVEVLRHARHDWLNKLQLIKGYASLNKMENIKGIVEEIIQEAQQESKLSNLHLPGFAELLLTYNWEPHTFQIEFEILDVDTSLLPDDGRLAAWTKEFFSCVDRLAAPYDDNRLYVSIETFQSFVRFIFEFSGTIKTAGVLEDWLKQQEQSRVFLHGLSPSSFRIEAMFS